MLIVVRHGRTEANASGRLLGRLDVPLDDVGTAQAGLLAAAVGPVDRVVSSPLLRARQTAAAFTSDFDVDDRWVELDYGEFDGVPIADTPSAMWRSWRSDPSFAPPGGESLADLGRRVRAALEELRQEAEERTVVVVSHVSPIKAATAWALAVGDEVTWRLYVAPASITRIGVGPDGAVVRTFNEIAHL
jgi:broad specificity phosphatase PhoE